MRHYFEKGFKDLVLQEGGGYFIVAWCEGDVGKLMGHGWKWQRVGRKEGECWFVRGASRVIYPTAFRAHKELQPRESKEQSWEGTTEILTPGLFQGTRRLP